MGLNRRKQTGKTSSITYFSNTFLSVFRFVCLISKFLGPLEAALVITGMVSIKSYKVMNLDKSRLKFQCLSSSNETTN